MQFGTITYESSARRGRPGLWAIDCERHVKSKLKRYFSSANKFSTGPVYISDKPENCRDLLWFLERYPMQVVDLERLKAGADAHAEMERKVAALLSNARPPDAFSLALPPRKYQQQAATLLETKTGLLLGDKVGLGKSVSAICSMTRPEYLPALVVTLTHLTDQWAEYLAKFAPQLKVHVLKKGTPYDLTAKKRRKKGEPEDDGRAPDVIVCNYHKLAGWADELAGQVRYVVFDEVQELRNPDSQKYAAAKEIADMAVLRMGLSATPVHNYGQEFFWVVDVLTPGALGTRDEFLREWCSDNIITDTQAFGDYLRREGLMLVRTRKDVGMELPPVSPFVLPIEVDHKLLDRVQTNAVELARTVLKSQQSFRNEKMMAAGQFDILMRQATGIAKAPYVAEFVRMLLESEDKVVLFGWHHEVYAIWREALREFKPVMYTGEESAKQKSESKKAFIEGDSRVLIISLRAGTGLDGLQDVCRVAVIGELDWSPSVHEQNIGRLDRDPTVPGLDLGPVFAYFLVAEDGSDPVMVDVLGLKKEQLQGVVNPEGMDATVKQIDPNHIKKLAQSYLERVGVSTADLDKAPEAESASAPASASADREVALLDSDELVVPG